MFFKQPIFIFILSSFLLLSASTSFSAATDNNQLLLKELRALADKSRQQRAADRWLQRSLDDLVARYDWPWQQNILFEDFSDGNYTHNPKWQVLSGHFQVIRGKGLFSQRHEQRPYSNQSSNNNDVPADDIGGLLVGALLDRALGSNGRPADNKTGSSRPLRNEPSSIRLKANVSNAFAMTMAFRQSAKQDTSFNISLMQNESSQYGYRLHLESGKKGFVELERVRRGRATIVEGKKLEINLSDNRLHDLAWRQTTDGTISVLLDDKVLFEVADRAFRDAYPWLQINLVSGDLAVRSLRIDGD